MPTEVEAKFLVFDRDLTPQLLDFFRSEGLEIQAETVVDIIDRYLDTADWRLHRAGWAYRWQEAGGQRKQSLKSLAGSSDIVQRREEKEIEVDSFPANGDASPNGELGMPVELTIEQLLELFHVYKHRRRYLVQPEAGTTIEVALDDAVITAGETHGKRAAGHMEFQELELELKEGSQQQLRKLVDAVQQKLGLLPARLSKFERGLQVAGLHPPLARQTASVSAERLERLLKLHQGSLSPSAPASRLAYQTLAVRFAEMCAEEPKAWEGLDPEGVHQMRVATRRIRAVLRAFKSVLPADLVKEFRREFKWLAANLGAVRDLDVYRGDLKKYASDIPPADAECLKTYERFLAGQWQQARGRLIDCLTSQRFRQLVERFAEFLESGPAPLQSKKSIAEAAEALIDRRLKRVLRKGRKIGPESPDTTFHALRIQCKRLRYLFEVFNRVYGKRLKSHIKSLKRLQDVLGKLQDACVATEQLRTYAESVEMQAENRGLLVTLGQLISQQRLHASTYRSRFHDVWEAFNRAGLRKQIRRVVQDS